MNKNKNLRKAMKNKNDEFYTLYEDVVRELDNYKDKFKDKIILCNCNDKGSAFERYFTENDLGIKELIITDGRFQDNIDALEKCDIVITNPPFSQFREFIDLLVEHNKDFIIVGPDNAVIYKNVFPLIREEKIFKGNNKIKDFIEPNGNIKKFGNIGWYTTFYNINQEEVNIVKVYNSKDYPKYDNYDAIEVSKIKDIPKDYDGVMGVPITFIDKWNKKQFEIIGSSCYPDSYKYVKNNNNYKDFIGYKRNGAKNNRTGSTFGNCPVIEKNDGKSAYYKRESDGKVVQPVLSKNFY